MKINPHDPATGWAPSERSYQNTGLTVRAQIAAMCLQGLLGDPSMDSMIDTADLAIAAADALIKKLNETS